MHSVSTVQCILVCFSGGHFANPVMSRLKECHLWRAPVGRPRYGTAAIAPWTSPRHGRYVSCSYTRCPQPLQRSVWRFIHLPPHPLLCWPYINTHRKKLLEIHPSAINRVSYMKVNRLLCLLLPIQDGQLH